MMWHRFRFRHRSWPAIPGTPEAARSRRVRGVGFGEHAPTYMQGCLAPVWLMRPRDTCAHEIHAVAAIDEDDEAIEQPCDWSCISMEV